MAYAYWSLGSNLGDREGYLANARRAFTLRFGGARFSRLYETEPVDVTDQPWFLNQVVEVESLDSPESLLEWARSLEASQGRQRVVPKGPRTLDVDLLLYGDWLRAEGDPLIPHPRMTQRRHVLAPLAELAPDLKIPGLSLTVARALEQVKDPAQVRIHVEP
ncbi:MAG TPA: 2-amino-4-hydroxy-6-hydroxymethyldihydropteridine diphosphokinase [bacterium]|nr:2-amino-4-hydroxy-6-hydroxymethyldihydropteridine diphosphokinase [bacterium]